MYCKNCGTELDDGAKFCKSCGNQVDSNNDAARRETLPSDEDRAKRKLSASFYVALINAPILFIIRMISSVSKASSGWRPSTTTYVPSGAKAIMFVFMIGIIVASISLKKESGVKKMPLKILMANILSAIVGILIIFIET